jgi:hypothetical protein
MRRIGRLLSLVFVSILLAAIAVTGCSNGQTEEPTRADVPLMSADEACALVNEYLQSEIDRLSSMTKTLHMATQSWLIEARPNFHADYMGAGRWSVEALGYVYDSQKEEWSFSSQRGLWYVYEASKIVEPGNLESRALLVYWQRYREVEKSSLPASTPTTTPNPTPTPSTPASTSEPEPTLAPSPPGASTTVPPPAPTQVSDTESVSVYKILDSDRAMIIRDNGETWILEKGVGCLSLDFYEGKQILIYSPGLFAGIGSKIILPDRDQQCKIWDAEYLGIEPTIIESHINGAFQGWDGDTIFELRNGQVWQQVSYNYTYHYAYSPEVFIYSTSGGYKMIVNGVSATIYVRRLK